MELNEIISLLGDFKELQKKISDTRDFSDVTTYQKQYDPLQHDIMDTTIRKDKLIETAEGKRNVKVSRIPTSLQKKIVAMAAAFLCGNPIELISDPKEGVEKNLFDIIVKIWRDNKLDFYSKKLAKLMMSETEVAELWYAEDAEKLYWAGTANDIPKVTKRLRMRILSNEDGDQMFPVFNNAGDMVAFGRGYTLKIDGKDEEHFDIYLNDKTILGVKAPGQSEWESKEVPNPAGKIPVIYYSQKYPEWRDVQKLIDRLEILLSNHADSNDYFASPSYFVVGELDGWFEKGEQGKVIKGQSGSDVKVLSWDQSPESLKMEFNNLRSLIFDLSDTPDISIEQMKSLGTYSGIALKMLFMGAHLKASDKEETFGVGIQRRINFLKTAIARSINTSLAKGEVLNIEPKFEYFMPKNVQEMIDILQTATSAKILSIESAVAQNPLVSDAEQEKKKLDGEKAASSEDEPIL